MDRNSLRGDSTITKNGVVCQHKKLHKKLQDVQGGLGHHCSETQVVFKFRHNMRDCSLYPKISSCLSQVEFYGGSFLIDIQVLSSYSQLTKDRVLIVER
jgi:hypothetical protein